MANITFTLAYVLATLLGLLSAYLMNIFSPNLNPLIKFFLLPILVIYIMFMVFRFLFPNLNDFGKGLKQYVDSRTENNINNTGYVEIFPPIFAVFLVIIILLYSGLFNTGTSQ